MSCLRPGIIITVLMATACAAGDPGEGDDYGSLDGKADQDDGTMVAALKSTPAITGSDGKPVTVPTFGARDQQEISVIERENRRVFVGVDQTIFGFGVKGGFAIEFEDKFTISTWIMGEGATPSVVRPGAGLDGHVWQDGVNRGRNVIRVCAASGSWELKTDLQGALRTPGGEVAGANGLSSMLVNTKLGGMDNVQFGDSIAKHTSACNDWAERQLFKDAAGGQSTIRTQIAETLRTIVSVHTFNDTTSTCNPVQGVYDNERCARQHQNVLGAVRGATTMACRRQGGEQFFTCRLESKAGVNCPYWYGDERVTSGRWEWPCRDGLACTLIKEPKYWYSWVPGVGGERATDGVAECRHPGQAPAAGGVAGSASGPEADELTVARRSGQGSIINHDYADGPPRLVDTSYEDEAVPPSLVEPEHEEESVIPYDELPPGWPSTEAEADLDLGSCDPSMCSAVDG